MGFCANQLSELFSLRFSPSKVEQPLQGMELTMNPVGGKCFKIPLNCFIFLFKILMVFFVQGPGQVLLDSGIPPIMENPAESSKRRPNSSTIPENYFG